VYRIGFFIVLILAVALGLLIGTLNYELITVDLLLVQVKWPLGLCLLSAMSIGLLAGVVLAWFFSVLPLRMRLRKVRQQKGDAVPYSDQPDA